MTKASTLKIEDVLVVALQEDPMAREAADLLKDVGERIVASTARGVLIDVSGLTLVDSHMARTLAGLVGTARLLGTAAVIVGIRPEVAITMVELGIELPDVATALDIDRGMANLRERIEFRA